MVAMTTVLVAGVVVLIGAMAARVLWRRDAGERHSVQEHQHTLETLRHMADRRQDAERKVGPRRRPRSAAPGPVTPADPAASADPARFADPAASAGPAGPTGRRATGAAPTKGARRRGRPVGRASSAKIETSRREALVFVDDALAGPAASAARGPLTNGRPPSMLTAGRFEPGVRPRPPLVVVVAVVVLAAVALGVALTWSSPPARRATTTTAAGRRPVTAGSGGRASALPAGTTLTPAVETADTATYRAPPAPYTVVLDASGSCWVLATDTATGTVLWTGTMAGGQSRSLSASGDLAVRLGAASDVRVSMDGTPVQLPSGFQSPFTMTFQVA